jgi:tetratricopeptide (TPR) repeat protein
MEDLRASVEIAKESGRGRDLVIATVNTGNWQTMYEGAEPGARTVQEAIALATRFGYAGLAVSMKFMSIGMLIDAGEIDEAVQVQEEVAQADSRLQEPSMSPHRIQALRGDAAEALSGAERYAALVLPSADSHPDKHVMVFARLAEVRVACGQYQAALGDVEGVLAVERRASTESYVGAALPYLTRAACAAGRVDLAEKMLSEVQRTPFPLADHAQAAARALIAEHRGRLEEAVAGHRDAAERWASFTMRIEEAHAHLGHARCLIALGRHDEAAAPIAAARAICERMGAKPMLADLAALDTGRPAQAGAG